MPGRPTLRQVASQAAQAEYQPQIQGVHRQAQGQVKSIKTIAPALEAGLQLSAQQLRHAGLSRSDLAIAETELAHRTADVAASTALQEQQVHQAAHGEILSLLQGEGQATRSGLTSLLHEAATHHQQIADEKAAEVRAFKNSILKAQTEKGLGLGTYSSSGSAGGLTGPEQRASAQSQHNAAYYAHLVVSEAKAAGGVDPKTGKQVLPAHPREYTPADWQNFVASVASKKGVSSTTDAERAVEAVREHFQPGTGAPKTPTDMLAHAAGATLGNLFH